MPGPDGSFANANKVILAFGTAAVRATLVLPKGLLWIDTDASGVPVGRLWAGDAATSGGKLVAETLSFPTSLALAGFTSSGICLFNALAIFAGGVSQVSSMPTEILFNITASNADGARRCMEQWGGTKGDGSQHVQMELATEHDGTGADELSRLLIRLNRTGTGSGAPLEKVRIDDHFKFSAGEVRHDAAKWVSVANGSPQALTVGGGAQTISFGTSIRTDGTHFSRSSTEITFLRAGWVEISAGFSMEPTGAPPTMLAGILYELQHQPSGGAYAGIVGGRAWSRVQIASSVAYSDSASIEKVLLLVGVNDKLRAQATPTGTGAVSTHTNGCRLTVRYVQAS